MLKDKLYILDNLFGHAYSSSWYNKPDLFEWVRTLDGEHIVITDNMLQTVDLLSINKKYAWLIESPSITPMAYEYIKNNYYKFDLIFTFDKELLSISDKFILVPYGGCWIDESDRNIYNKSKLISVILSSKKTTDGHKLRHQIINEIPNIDIYGFTNPIENKITALKDYMFTIVIENHKKDYYFTEKLIDSFITGTIPIYWGCPSINKFFDTNGMLIFNDINELKNIINNLTSDLYHQKLKYINYNFVESKKYLVADNFIYKLIKNEKILS